MAFPDPVTSDLRPKTEVSVYAFSEANASWIMLVYTPYGPSQASELHIFSCARQSLRVCLSAYTGHSRRDRDLNYLTLTGEL